MSSPNKINRFYSSETLQLGLLLALSLIEALSVLIAIGLFLQLYPLQNATDEQIVKEWVYLFKPNRDILFYRTFLVLTFSLHGLLLLIFRKKFGSFSLTHFLIRFILTESFLLCIALFGLFQYFTYADSLLAKKILYCWGGLFLLTKIFWKSFKSNFRHFSSLKNKIKSVDLILTILCPIFIFIAIYIPDPAGLITRIYNSDHFYHFDGVIMSTAWASLKGGIPNIDMINPYGIGMPMMIGALSKWLGGFTYENILSVLILLTILYFIFCFFLLKIWLKNIFLAIAGVLLAIKLQMFHYGTYPIIWQFPNATVVRYFFDIIFFLLLFCHSQRKNDTCLILAAVCSGFSVFYISDCGIYQLATYLSYLIILFLVPEHRQAIYSSYKDILKIIIYVTLPILTVLLCLKVVIKDFLWSPVFWKNISEQISLFMQGFGAIPVRENFKDGNVFSLLFGCIILLTYLAAVLIPASKFYRSQKIASHEIFAATLGIYGLLFFHYYICQATAARYFCTSVPFVFLLCYRINNLLNIIPAKNKQKISALLAFTALMTLITTRLFIEYPNLIASSHNTFTKDREEMSKEAIAEEDIELIKQFTSPNQQVCLLSSNETWLLMQADRKPFFFYFPLFSSRPPSMSTFGNLYLFTKTRLEKTLKQIQSEKPAYVFMEKRLWSGKLLALYYRRNETLKIIIRYLDETYVPQKSGKYLVVLKRRDLP